jgi:Flp pilus assembly protein TadD
LKNYQAAVDNLTKAKDLGAAEAEVYQLLGYARFETGDFESHA